MSDASFLQQEAALSLSNRLLHLILMPTEKCNFRCTYCYEDFSIGRMSPQTIASVEQLIARRAPDLTQLTIEWFGGEPLIAQDIVARISRHASEWAARSPGLRYRATMTTNGYHLGLGTVEELLAVGVDGYQVSLDGPGPHHDRTRLRSDGAGSFNRIWSNLSALRESSLPVDVLLRMHLMPGNLSVIEDFLIEVRERFLGDRRFSVLLKPIERLGGKHDDQIEVLPHHEAAVLLSRLNRLVHADTANGCHVGICYAAKPSSFVIRADASIAKCTVALGDERNRIGRLTPDGLLELDNTKIRPWLRGLMTLDPEILACPAAYLIPQQPPQDSKIHLKVTS